jgi:hypothetical protein
MNDNNGLSLVTPRVSPVLDPVFRPAVLANRAFRAQARATGKAVTVRLGLEQTEGRADEEVTLLTSAPPDQLDAPGWLALNRAGFGGIENGLHQRLDVSHNDDRCRIRTSPTRFVWGLFSRISNSLFMEWRSHQPT